MRQTPTATPVSERYAYSTVEQAPNMDYRRTFVAGGTFFFTVVTENRRPLLQGPSALATLRASFRHVRVRHPFTLDAAVVLPDHLHCIWTLPPGDVDFAIRWRLIKTHFTKHCDPSLRTPPNAARRRKNQQALWQHRYWEHLIRDETDLVHHVEYIHYNPVKHGLTTAPIAWPYSSFRRYVADGHYPADWGASPVDCGDAGHE